jgi:acetyltransferase-like isoleucine patch superfamily enzyme
MDVSLLHMTQIDITANVSPLATIGTGCAVWAYTHIREEVKIGANCIVGSQVYIGPGVEIGSNCKIQNQALIYEPAILEDGVFIGPGAVLTNDLSPRAIRGDENLKKAEDWIASGVHVMKGASLGAGVICVAGITVGEFAMVGAGSILTKHVSAHALVVGNPARQIGWVCKCGKRLSAKVENVLQCDDQCQGYKLDDGRILVKI